MEYEEYDFEEYHASQHAIRDILYMYWCLLRYKNLYHDFGFEDGDFDPLVFIDIPNEYLGDDKESRLLREGSGIKILCHILQAYSQGNYPRSEDEFLCRVEAALHEGRFRQVPEIEQAVRDGLVSEEALQQRSQSIYQMHVVRFLEELAIEAKTPYGEALSGA